MAGPLATANDPDPARRYGSVDEFVVAFGGSSAPTVARLQNPYVGLRAFQEADADRFCGRDRLVKDLLERLRGGGELARFLAVIGPSGSGKSSVVRAGLIPALRSGAVDGSATWFVATMVPGADPFESLGLALGAVSVQEPPDPETLRRSGPGGLGPYVEAVLPPPAELLIVIDQAEELFTLTDESTRGEFLVLLTDAVVQAGSRVRVVLTLRADFYDRPLRYQRFGGLLHRGHVAVVPMEPDELTAAIELPAASAGITLEPGLRDSIVADFAANPQLPLLQHALAELFDRRAGERLTHDAYRDLGGLAGGLARRAETVLADCSDAERAVARRVFTRMVTLGEGVADTRRRVERRELDDLAGNAHEIDGLLQRFGSARLVTFDHERDSREPTVEIAHEALLTRWNRLATWIDEDREGVRILRHLTTASRSWADLDRDPAELLRGTRLEATLAWAETHGPDLGTSERDYLAASRDQRDADEHDREVRARQQVRQNRRLRRLLGATGVAAAVALVAGTVAFVQRNDAEKERDASALAQSVAQAAQADAEVARDASDVDRLVAQAIADADETPDRALLLAAAAYQIDPSAATAGALQSALIASPPGFLGYIPAGELGEIELGRDIAARHTYESVEIIDLDSRKVTVTIPDPGANTQISLSADDRLVALGGSQVRVYEAASGELAAVFDAPAQAIYVEFHPTEPNQIAVGYEDGSSGIVDWQTGEVVTALPMQGDQVRVVTFSPDGHTLAAATGPDESAVRAFDSVTGLEVMSNRTLPGSILFQYDLAFDATGTRLVGVDRFGFGRVWAVPSGELISTTENGYGFEALTSVQFVSDDLIYATGPSGELVQWDANTGEHKGVIEPHAGLAASFDLDPDGERLGVGGNSYLALLDFRGGGPARTVYPYPPAVANGVSDVTGLYAELSADGSRIALYSRGSIWTWRLGEDVDSVEPIAPPWAGMISLGLNLSDDGERLFVQNRDSNFQAEMTVYDTSTGDLVAQIPTTRAVSTAVSPDGRWMAVAGIRDPRKPTLQIFDLDSGEVAADLDELAAVTEDVDPLRGSHVTSLAFSADSHLLAAANHRGAAMIWDLRTMAPLGPPVATGDGEVLDIGFSVDGTEFATIGSDNTIRIRDVATREETGDPLRGPTGLAFRVHFNEAGQLLTGGSDGVRLWDTDAGLAIGRPFPLPAWSEFRWLPDGRHFLATGIDGIERWDTDPDAWYSLACELAGRDLTEDEWARFGTVDPVPTCDS